MADYFLSYLFVTGGVSTLGAVFAAFMFSAAIWKPASIQSVILFRRAVILFALSSILPPAAELLLTVAGEPLPFVRPYGSYSLQSANKHAGVMLCIPLMFVCGKLLFPISVALGILSLVRNNSYDRKASRVPDSFEPPAVHSSSSSTPPADRT